jgi:hypothetical protein
VLDVKADAGHDAIAGKGNFPRPAVRVQKRPKSPHKSRTDFTEKYLPHSCRTVLQLPHKIALEKPLNIAQRCENIPLLTALFMLYSGQAIAQNRSHEQH